MSDVPKGRFERIVFPQNEADAFIPMGWANAPLHQIWARTTSNYSSTQAKLGGFLLLGNPFDPANVEIGFSEGLDGLATPNAYPLDLVIVHGVNVPKIEALSDVPMSNYMKEKEGLDLTALVLYYDLETNDPTKTRAWISTETCSYHTHVQHLTSFRQEVVYHWFKAPVLKKRIARFHKKLRESLGR